MPVQSQTIDSPMMESEGQPIELVDTTVTALPRLQPGQKIEHIEYYPQLLTKALKPPSALRELLELTDVESFDRVGEHGPPNASSATKAHEGIDSLGLFENLFGRDSLTVSLLLFDVRPELAEATVKRACELQGVVANPMSEEEPGKTFHEYREDGDPLGRQLTAEKGWQWPYYGTVDASELFIRTLALCVKKNPAFLLETYTGKDGQTHTIEYALTESLNWQINKQNSNAEGLLEFKRMNPHGIENQAWKDSGDSYFHADGTLANHDQGIASIEVQALAYDARIDAAEMFDQLAIMNPAKRQEYQEKSKECRAGAARLKAVILDKFWVEDERGGYFALGSDRDDAGNLRILKIRTSNMGRLLDSRLLEGNDPEIIDKREKLIRTLFSEEMLGAAGVRTLSSREVRYSAGAYHNGSVWPFDSYLVALGLERHGYYGLANDLKRRFYNIIKETNLLPEFVRGESDKIALNTREIYISDEEHKPINNRLEELKRLPKIEQPPQEIQAWTVAAWLRMKFENDPFKPNARYRPSIALDLEKRKLERELLEDSKPPQAVGARPRNDRILQVA